MQLVESPGTLAVPTSEIGRYALFTVSLAATRQPDDSQLFITASASVTENLNFAIRQLRDNDAWLWIMGDDHVWMDDLLMQMLATLDDHPEIDVLVPLCCKRNPPWHLVLYKELPNVIHESGVPAWQPLSWDEIPDEGVLEVDGAGSAGMLIRRHVLDALGDPWFQSSGGVVLNEDLTFCRAARDHGFRIFATADQTLGHLGIFNVRPAHRPDGKWAALTEFTSPEEQFRHLYMPVLDGEEAVGAAR